MADNRRHPDEFLDEVREMRARREQRDASPINPATADQMQAANRDARRIMGQAPGTNVIDVDVTEREEALMLALAASAGRRGLSSPNDPALPRPELVDLFATGRPRHCDICDTRAYRLEEMHAQYGPYIFRARVCVRCRKFAPGKPVADSDEAA